MHASVYAWANEVVMRDVITGKDVWEAGAFDVNGSLKPAVMVLHPKSYTGTDIRSGPNVDRVLPAEDWPVNVADTVICTEMLEHAQSWHAALAGLVRALRSGGYLILSTRGPGFPRHDHPGDYHRFTPAIMKNALVFCGLTDVIVTEDPEAPGVFATAFQAVWPSHPRDAFWSLEAKPVE